MWASDPQHCCLFLSCSLLIMLCVTHTLTITHPCVLSATIGMMAATTHLGGEHPLESMEQYHHYEQGAQPHDAGDYAHYWELDPNQEFYEQEEAMLAHIPGTEGRAATAGDQFSSTIFGTGFGYSAKPTPLPDNNIPVDIHDTITDEHESGFLSNNNTSNNICVNPFAGTTTPRQRWRNTATRIWDTLIPVMWCFHTLLHIPSALGLPRTRSVMFAMIIAMVLLVGAFPTTAAQLCSPPFLNATALATNFGATTSALHKYLINSGCSTSIISDTRHLQNIRPCIPVHVRGLTGVKTLVLRADLHLPVRTATHCNHTLTLKDVLYDPDGHYNLVSSDQLNESKYDVLLTSNATLSSLHFRDSCNVSRHVPITKVGKLFDIPVFAHDEPDPIALVSNCGSMTLEELYHLRMAHTPLTKLAAMSHQVKGVPRPLQFREALRFPCSVCTEAKAIKQHAPPASTTVSHSEDDLVTWDLIDMGDKHTTIRGNRYISLFVIHRSRYAITILHKNRADFRSVLLRAFAKMGFTPKVVRSDGAAEYLDDKLAQFFIERGIQHQVSNPHEQFQNAVSEKFVDTLGKGIRTLLLQSQLPPEFWGCAAHFYTDVYNHLPHASIQNYIPYGVHHRVQPDISWFRPFGCDATIYRGKDLVEHGKLAPRGEKGVFVGLGMTHGRKCWLVFSPRLNRIFATRNVSFDETLFPLKGSDQRIFGRYDNHAIQQMRADAYGLPEGNEVEARLLHDIIAMPLPATPTTSTLNVAPVQAITPEHPDELLSQHPTQPAFDIPNDDPNVPCEIPSSWGNTTSTHGGGASLTTSAPSPSSSHSGSVHRGGAPTSVDGGGAPAAEGTPLVGETRPLKRPRFTEAPPSYVSWQSVRQQVVALSSAEAEYYAASVAGTDVTYLRRLLSDLGYAQGAPTILYEDNMACIYMSCSSAMYHKARHIDTRVYHLRELCRRGEMKLEKVASEFQAADSLTKSTPRPLFVAHRDVFMGRTALLRHRQAGGPGA
mmetsp:Transcript_61225/g.126463  ORF Transcript_61225/g.126463 Transcript_61225/m.126463 type:complete len:1000 (-) Transcript_61225:457-3456(-)